MVNEGGGNRPCCDVCGFGLTATAVSVGHRNTRFKTLGWCFKA